MNTIHDAIKDLEAVVNTLRDEAKGMLSLTCARYDRGILIRPEWIATVETEVIGANLYFETLITLVNGEQYRVKDTKSQVERKLDRFRQLQLDDMNKLRQENIVLTHALLKRGVNVGKVLDGLDHDFGS